MRTFTSVADDDVRHHLEVLIDPASPQASYKEAMIALGRRLGAEIARPLAMSGTEPICVVCTVEDADFLARGLIEGIENAGVDAKRLKLICFWNERIRRFVGTERDLFDVAPVIKEYRELASLGTAVLVVVKSIISGACVVKTNLAMLIDGVTPSRVVVAAPVMLKGADERLASEFTSEVAGRFEYLTFAIDDQKDQDDNVVPGIGGSVYERLGFEAKNTHVPELVRQRRRRLATA